MNQLFTLALLFAQGGPAPALSPDAVCRLALADLANLSAAEQLHAKNYRYLSFHAVPAEDLVRWRRLLAFWVHTMSGSQSAVSLPVEVRGSLGRLVRLDITDYTWSQAAWRAVAQRDPYFREPLIGSAVAKLLRDAIGEPSDVRTFHVFAVVRADHFFRETCETQRSPSYYDLLYAEFRFPTGGATTADKVPIEVATKTVQQRETVPWPGGKFPEVGKPESAWTYYPPGAFPVYTGKVIEVAAPGGKAVAAVFDQKAVDFPKDKADWDKAWGLDKQNDFIKASKKRVFNGAVVLGMGDGAEHSSFVARNNRFLSFAPSPVCVAGAALESYDTDDPTGEQDYVTQAPNLARGLIKFKAQELLVSMPNGAQAALLTAGDQGKRAEFADPGVAIDTTDIVTAQAKFAGISRKLDARVRTPGSCVVCHAPAGGVISPGRLIEDLYGDFRNPLYIKDPVLRNDFRSVFVGWHDKVDVLRTPLRILIKNSTAWVPPAKVWTGLEVSNAVFDGRVWYDRPVDLAQVLRETGLTLEQYTAIAKYGSEQAWIPLLLNGKAVPRRTYEINVYPELAKLAALTGAVPTLAPDK